MDKTISITVTCGKNIFINFKLNVRPVLHLVPAMVRAPAPASAEKRYYGEINIYLNMTDGHPFLMKRYEFANFTSIIPQLKKNYAGNFIENIQYVLSMLQVILDINQNPWLILGTTSSDSGATPTTPTTPYVNLKTKESFRELPAGIHPWTTRVNEDGRTYYVNSLTNEISWNPQGETHLSHVLRDIIECLQTDKTKSDLQSEINESLIDAKIMNTKIDIVIVIRGHSYCDCDCGSSDCGIEKPELEEDMCLLTLSLLRDSLVVSATRLMDDNGSRIIKVFQSSSSQSPTVSSFVDVALELRSKRLVNPRKVNEKSIGVKCGSARSASERRITFTEQFFFGGKKEKRFLEGIFMLTKDTPEPVDISSWNELTTPSGMIKLYKDTNEFQKKIIEFESEYPQSTVLDLEKHFASQANAAAADDEDAKAAAEAKAIEEFKNEWENLKVQRKSFCISLGIIEKVACMMSCKGVDVMDLQKYYDNIVDWERKNKIFAFDYFENSQNGIEEFMKEFQLGPDDPENKKIEGALMMLSYKRKEQVIKNLEKINELLASRADDKEVEPLEIISRDYQLVPSSYQEERSSNILKKLHQMFTKKKILVIFEGCRGVPNDSGEPYDSEDDSSSSKKVGRRKVRRGGEKQNMKSCKNKIKKQNMKSCKNKIKKQNMKSYKNKIKKRNMKSCKNKK